MNGTNGNEPGYPENALVVLHTTFVKYKYHKNLSFVYL